MYLVKSPWLFKFLYPSYIWNINTKEKIIYLTFDDGPNAIATPFVLETLLHFNAKATFFCIGKNVEQFPEIYKSVIDEGHTVGNHTQNHLNGWKTKDDIYFENVKSASKNINSKLFRPPYGKIKKFQAMLLQKAGYKIIMWDVLCGDFDQIITKEKCLENVILSSKSGSIIVFHDSEKAFKKLEFALPKVLAYFTNEGYKFESLKIEP